MFTSVGYGSQQQKVDGQSTINVVLSTEAKSLDDVVVTALGLRREKRSLGYSVTTVPGSALTEARETNFVNGLEGKSGRRQCKQCGHRPGRVCECGNPRNFRYNRFQSASICNRWYPDAKQYYRQTDIGGGYGGADGGDGTININPDDIETVTVLKGAAATALYGYRGSKGVILITTKSGKNAKGCRRRNKFQLCYSECDRQY